MAAIGVVKEAKKRGIPVPGKLAVVGFDDSEVAIRTRPNLTTMTNPASQLCSRAAELLIEILGGSKPATEVILPSRLIIRDSA